MLPLPERQAGEAWEISKNTAVAEIGERVGGALDITTAVTESLNAATVVAM